MKMLLGILMLVLVLCGMFLFFFKVLWGKKFLSVLFGVVCVIFLLEVFLWYVVGGVFYLDYVL